jgi:hypothetical protein
VHDVEIGQAGLDHDHVRALVEVERDLAQGLVGIRRIHLVAVLVALAQARRGADGVAEWAVEAGGVLGRVREDARVDEAGGLERVPDRADASIHHVGGRDHVGAGLGVRERLLHERRHGRVVHHVAGLVDQAVLAVAGVGIERDVGDHAELGVFALERAHRALHQTVVVPGLVRVQRLRLQGRHGEQRERGDSQRVRLAGGAKQLVDAEPLDTRHRGHGLAGALALAHEHGPDQVVRGKHRLAHQPAREGIAAHAPQAGIGIGHRRKRSWRAPPRRRFHMGRAM